jgi:hypothetical protein
MGMAESGHLKGRMEGARETNVEVVGVHFSAPIHYFGTVSLPSHIRTWGLSKIAMQSPTPGVTGIQATTTRPGAAALPRFLLLLLLEW